MYWPNIGSRQSLGAASFLALTLILTSHAASAQDTRGGAIERDIATLNQQIATKQQQIATLRGRPSAETTELNTAQQKLAEARAAYKANASADNESKAKNAEFKVKLAEIKYNKAHPDVNTLVDEVEQLQSQLASKQREAKEAREAPARPAADVAEKPQPKPVDNQAAKRQQEQQRQQEQELARSKQESEAQQKEIERLKAALAAKEAKEKEVAAPAPTAKAAAPAPISTPAKPAAATNTAGGGAMKLITAQEVTQELQRLEQRLAGPGPARGANDAMYLRHPDTKATNKDKVILRALGKEQYKGQTTVEAGQYLISAGFNQWPVEFSASEAGPITFVYDNSDPQKARMFIYSSGLEGSK